jgi:hypothetical protein
MANRTPAEHSESDDDQGHTVPTSATQPPSKISMEEILESLPKDDGDDDKVAGGASASDAPSGADTKLPAANKQATTKANRGGKAGSRGGKKGAASYKTTPQGNKISNYFSKSPSGNGKGPFGTTTSPTKRKRDPSPDADAGPSKVPKFSKQ